MDDYRDAIASCCRQLRLSANLADNAFAIQGETHQEYLYNLLSEEIKCRKAARIGKLINSAGFPVQHNFAAFHPDEVQFPSGVTPESLKALEFFRAGNNLVMYGSTGTGKTMLSICIGMEACRMGIPVKFFRTASLTRSRVLINQLSEAQERGSLAQLHKKLDKADILILDEFGYVPYNRTGAQLLFDYLSESMKRKSLSLIPIWSFPDG